MDDVNYKPRIADKLLTEKLQGMGAVLIEGPKWCGKTTTAMQQAASVLRMDNPNEKRQYINTAAIDPTLLLEGDVPRLIDEWQLAPQLWDAVRYTVDERNAEGQFILTGSTAPVTSEQSYQISHTGTGRIARLKMRTMSLWESGESTGAVSLSDLFSSEAKVSGVNSTTLEDIAFFICRGGWPRATLQSREIALGRAFDYYDAIVNSDVNGVDRSARNIERVKLIMRSYARLQGTQTPLSAICQDMAANDDSTLDDRTVFSYLSSLKNIFVVEDMPAWNPNLRSKTAVRTSDTRYFIDPSIATAALDLEPKDLMHDLNTFGLLFETMCVRDLRIYADCLHGQVYHFRDKNGLECDAVVHLRNGSYGLVEIKLGGDKLIEEGVATLTKLSRKIDTARQPAPAFLMVLVAVGSYAYRRADGVYVVPVSCLRD